jgi:hypothetical protein
MQRMLLLGLAVTVYSFSSAMDDELRQKASQAIRAGWHVSRYMGCVKIFPSPLQTRKQIGNLEIHAVFYGDTGDFYSDSSFLWRKMNKDIRKKTLVLTEQQYKLVTVAVEQDRASKKI